MVQWMMDICYRLLRIVEGPSLDFSVDGQQLRRAPNQLPVVSIIKNNMAKCISPLCLHLLGFALNLFLYCFLV